MLLLSWHVMDNESLELRSEQHPHNLCGIPAELEGRSWEPKEAAVAAGKRSHLPQTIEMSSQECRHQTRNNEHAEEFCDEKHTHLLVSRTPLARRQFEPSRIRSRDLDM